MAEVEDFAGIGSFLDQPAKVYSSGMLVRLAFATQTILASPMFDWEANRIGGRHGLGIHAGRCAALSPRCAGLGSERRRRP